MEPWYHGGGAATKQAVTKQAAPKSDRHQFRRHPRALSPVAKFRPYNRKVRTGLAAMGSAR
jgi:hypothetical protein